MLKAVMVNNKMICMLEHHILWPGWRWQDTKILNRWGSEVELVPIFGSWVAWIAMPWFTEHKGTSESILHMNKSISHQRCGWIMITSPYCPGDAYSIKEELSWCGTNGGMHIQFQLEREQFPTKKILKPSCNQNTERIQPPKKKTGQGTSKYRDSQG